jgi:hypothetical protein
MYKKFLLPSLILVTGTMIFSSLAVRAEEDLPKLRNTLFFVGAEAYKFTERDGPTDLAEDKGVRANVGIGWSNLFVPSGGAVYRASITGYAGIADYVCVDRPSTCPLGGAESESRYVGARLEGMGGYRFGTVIGVEVFSGVVFDVWNRSIQDGTIIGGGTYAGYDTYNAVGSFKLGASLIQRFNSFGYFLRGGVKAPFVAWQRIDILDGVEVAPGAQMSFFANLDLTFGALPRDRFVISLYYDTLNLTKSSSKILTDNGVPITTLAAPASRSSTLGAQMIFGF